MSGVIAQIGMDEVEILHAAFRYYLGRSTAAASDFARQLASGWHYLSPQQQKDMVKEIRQALDKGQAGVECDQAAWQRVVDVHCNLCPDCRMVYYNCLCSHDS